MCFQSALANLRAAIVALANSNSGATGTTAQGAVVLVSNLNEKVIIRIQSYFFNPSLLYKNFKSFFLTTLHTPFYPTSLSHFVCALDLPSVLLPSQDDYSSCSVHSLWYVSSFFLYLPYSAAGYVWIMTICV